MKAKQRKSEFIIWLIAAVIGTIIMMCQESKADDTFTNPFNPANPIGVYQTIARQENENVNACEKYKNDADSLKICNEIYKQKTFNENKERQPDSNGNIGIVLLILFSVALTAVIATAEIIVSTLLK